MKSLKWFDAGVNLLNSQYDKDRAQVLADARASGIDKQLIISSNYAESLAALEVSRAHLDLFSTAGVHPHDASQAEEHDFAAIEALFCSHPSVVAIGECGLDYNRNYSPATDQKRVFEKQLEIAANLSAPLYLHQRDAHEDFLSYLKNPALNQCNKLVHCFTGDKEALNCYLELDCYIGITGWACDERRGQGVLELISEIPLHRLILETDAPFLLPRNIQPKPKSRRNQPQYLPWIGKKIAQTHAIDIAQLAQSSLENSCRLFKIPPLDSLKGNTGA